MFQDLSGVRADVSVNLSSPEPCKLSVCTEHRAPDDWGSHLRHGPLHACSCESLEDKVLTFLFLKWQILIFIYSFSSEKSPL